MHKWRLSEIKWLAWKPQSWQLVIFIFEVRLPGWLSVKNLPANAGDTGDPWLRKIPWGREWQPTPIFLPGKSHGQRSLVGYSPWGCRIRHNWVTKRHTVADQSRVQIFLHSYASIFILMNILFLLGGRRLMVQVVGGKKLLVMWL